VRYAQNYFVVRTVNRVLYYWRDPDQEWVPDPVVATVYPTNIKARNAAFKQGGQVSNMRFHLQPITVDTV